MAFSVTGGSQSLTVVFGWSVVIKYVLLELVMLNPIERFPACLISQAGRKSVGLISASHVVLGTLGGAFILDYLGAKYTMVSVKSRSEDPSYRTDLGLEQISGLLLQAVVGFIMSGLYEK